MELAVLMAGLGKRFSDGGYTTPKPLIKIKDKTILDWTLTSVESLLADGHPVSFAIRVEHEQQYGVKRQLTARYGPTTKFLEVQGPIRGNLHTGFVTSQSLMADKSAPILFLDSDNKYEISGFQKLLSKIPEKDYVVLCYFQLSNQEDLQWGFCAVDPVTQKVSKLKEKEKLESGQPMIGFFYWSSAAFFEKIASETMRSEAPGKNSEYYMTQGIDYAVRTGYAVYAFKSDIMVPLGTPEDVKVFENQLNKPVMTKHTNNRPQFFFDTADEVYIRKTWEFFKTNADFVGTDVVGITSNPNAMSKINALDMDSFDRVVRSLCRAITEIRGGSGGVVYVQFPQMTMPKELMHKFVDHVLTLSDGVTKVGLKIPPYQEVLEMVPEFSKKIDTNVTGISDAATALKCVSYGVRYISILNGRMEEIGIDAKKQVEYIKQSNLGNTEIITASMRTIEGLAWVVAAGTVPTIGSRVLDLFIAKGEAGAQEFRNLWKPHDRDLEFAPVITPNMTLLSLDFFNQMDTLGAPLLESFQARIQKT